MSRGRPTIEQAADMENRLLDAAWSVVTEGGPENLSIERVAQRAQAGKKTIYARYANKRDLLGNLLARRLRMFLADIALPGPVAGQSAQDAFAALAQRQLAALATGQGQWMERLVDWLDATDTDDRFHDAKQRSYVQVMTYLDAQLAELADRTGISFSEGEDVAVHWLDGIVGHSRTTSNLTEKDIAIWAQRYAKLFLKAVG